MIATAHNAPSAAANTTFFLQFFLLGIYLLCTIGIYPSASSPKTKHPDILYIPLAIPPSFAFISNRHGYYISIHMHNLSYCRIGIRDIVLFIAKIAA